MQRVAARRGGASRTRRGAPSGGLALLLVALLALAAAHTAAAMGVVGIDYGTESTKISLVKPGMPFDVVLSRDSKRKVPSAVAWKMQERLHGSDATSLATRYPGDTFVAAKLLMGRSFDDANAPARERVAGLLNTELFASQRGTCEARRATDYTVDKSGADSYTVEELVGAQLSHARTLAEETAGEEFRRSYPGSVGNFGGLDVVITVPVFWTAAERQSMMDAAEIAGFKPRLVSDGAAVGVNYAQSRTFATPERHLFYDAGAGSTRATIVEFSTKTVQAESVISIGSTQKEAVVVDVLSAGWNREASGLALDLLIRDVLADKFTEGHAAKLSKPVREQPRAMARLLKEANRVKHILSANAEASVNIEGLADDVDFRSRLSRDDFEALVDKAGLTPAFGEPVAEALRNAKMKISDLTSVVLVGGMSRVPLVQAALRAAGVPDSKVAQNVNADEAAVMGAAFYGAEFNPQFRMKSIRAHDGNAYPVVLREKGGKDEVIYPQGPFLQERHERKYKDVHEDFSFDVSYAASSKSKLDTFTPELYRIELVEIHNHLAGLKERGEIEQVDIDLNVTLVTQPLGIYSVESAWLNVKQKPTSIAGALRSFFNVGAQRVDDDDDEAEDVSVNATEGADASEPLVVVNATDDKNATAAAKPKKAKKPVPTDRAIRIVGRAVSVGSTRPMSGSELKTAKDRLYVANVEMRRRAAKEEARNVLEAYIYRARDIVHDENFGAASKRKERDDIAAKAEELSEWLNEREAELAPTDKLKSKLASLQALVSPIEKRMAEQSGRGAAVRRFTTALEETRAFVVQARANLSEALAAGTGSKYSSAELDTLSGNVERDDKWYREGEAKQARKKADEDPVFKVDELDKRGKKLRDTVKRLASRRIPKTRPPKKSKEPKASSSASESASTSSASASPAASDAPPKHEEL